jgi:hypothetical protein
VICTPGSTCATDHLASPPSSYLGVELALDAPPRYVAGGQRHVVLHHARLVVAAAVDGGGPP